MTHESCIGLVALVVFGVAALVLFGLMAFQLFIEIFIEEESP